MCELDRSDLWVASVATGTSVCYKCMSDLVPTGHLQHCLIITEMSCVHNHLCVRRCVFITSLVCILGCLLRGSESLACSFLLLRLCLLATWSCLHVPSKYCYHTHQMPSNNNRCIGDLGIGTAANQHTWDLMLHHHQTA